MVFKRKNYDTEINFWVNMDFGFWALPCSICGIVTPSIGCLTRAFTLIIRVLCFQFSWEIWKWDKEVTDINDSVENILNG